MPQVLVLVLKYSHHLLNETRTRSVSDEHFAFGCSVCFWIELVDNLHMQVKSWIEVKPIMIESNRIESSYSTDRPMANSCLYPIDLLVSRPTSRSSGTGTQNQNGGVSLPAGIADDQSKDFDFEKTEMKYDSTGMFHWSPAKSLEDCILVSLVQSLLIECGLKVNLHNFSIGSQPGGHDRAERPRGRVPVCRSRFAADWAAESGDAAAGIQLPLPRAETRGHRGLGGLHKTRVEDAAEPAQDLGAQRIAAEPCRPAGR